MIWLFIAASALVDEGWTTYRAGSRDCHMRRVDSVSQVVIYGSDDCTAKKKRKLDEVRLDKVVTLRDGTHITARIVSDDEAPASAPQAKLLKLFPGPTRLQLLHDDEVIAETMGSAREVLGLASNGYAIVVMYRYVREANDGDSAVEVLGVQWRTKSL